MINSLAFGACLAFVAWILHGSFKVVRNRWRLRNLPTAGPYSLLWGSIPSFAEMKNNVPDDLHFHCWSTYFRKRYGLTDEKVMYIDLTPIQPRPELWILDADLAARYTVKQSLPKSTTIRSYISPVAGWNSMVSLEGAAWKSQRSLYHSGFSASHLLSLTPLMMRETHVFLDIMRQNAREGKVFSLEESLTRLTFGIISSVILPVNLNCQTTENEFITEFRAQSLDLRRVGSLNPFINASPFRKWRLERRTTAMEKYLGKILDDAYESRTNGTVDQDMRTVIDLAFDEYEKTDGKSKKGGKLDGTFRAFAMDQVKTFLFAGHDTTSSALTYTYYLLHLHPAAHATLSHELTTVLGPDTSTSISTILSNPAILNSLPYTTACFKESMRLFPPASSRRGAHTPESPEFLHDPETGKNYPTFGCTVWPVGYHIQRSEKYWPEPDSFIPERWIPGLTPFPDAKIDREAWIPFSRGPRNCIGQELAMLEGRLILALTVREFDFIADFPEVAKVEKHSQPTALKREGKWEVVRPYQILNATAKPKGGMRGRIYFRDQTRQS